MPLSLFASGSPESPPAIRRLIALRWSLLVAELAAILGVPSLLAIPLPRGAMLVVVALQAFANALAARRLARTGRFSDIELTSQLFIDIVALAVLMFFSGGAA